VFNFTKTNRILKKLEFKTVLDNGSKVVSDHLVVYGRAGEDAPRLGLIVSRKVGNSVARNLVKRRIREIFRLKLPDLTKTPGIDFVVIARHTASNTSYIDLSRALEKCISRIQGRLKLGTTSE
jgi:ribonuclease P protein component